MTSPLAENTVTPVVAAPVVTPLLFVHVTAHSDLEQQRIASKQRLTALTNTEPDADGIIRGYGLPASHPDVARLAVLTEALETLEHQAELNLKAAMRKCRIHPWVKAQAGLGEKQVGRLLGVIGDPYWNMSADQPRTVSQLWAYAGLHVLPKTGDPGHGLAEHISGDQCGNAGVAARHRKGQRSNWSTEAKTRAFLCATSCIKKAASPYRPVYDDRRAHTADTHPEWTAAHSHNDGLRIVSKAILRDLWREAKRLHEEAA